MAWAQCVLNNKALGLIIIIIIDAGGVERFIYPSIYAHTHIGVTLPGRTLTGSGVSTCGHCSAQHIGRRRAVRVEEEKGRVDEVAGQCRVEEQWLCAGQLTCRKMAKTFVHRMPAPL